MEDFNKPHSKDESSLESSGSYRLRKGNSREDDKVIKWWVLPLVLLLLLASGLGVVWYLGSFPILLGNFFTPREQTATLALPEALIEEANNKRALTEALGEESIAGATQGVEGILTYELTVEAKGRLLEEAEFNLSERVAALQNMRHHPYIYDLSHNNAYRELCLIVDREILQYEQILVSAAELYILAAFYRHIDAGADSTPELVIILEDAANGNTLGQLVYPDDLARVTEILISAEAPAAAPTTPQPGDQVIVTTGADNLNLRSGPEITYLIIDILSSGTILEVTGVEGSWLQVVTPQGKEGWVHGGYVEILN
jgi:hypothetical protein